MCHSNERISMNPTKYKMMIFLHSENLQGIVVKALRNNTRLERGKKFLEVKILP